MVFDVESIGLHGEGFAVGYVVTTNKGERLEEGMFACDSRDGRGTKGSHDWIEKNIGLTSKDSNCSSPYVVRETFWGVYQRWKATGRPLLLWADCSWPVEARFLISCIEDGHVEREWDGPYPLMDIATYMFSHGFDPLAVNDRLPDELPEHNPLCDARQSTRFLEMLLAKR